MTTPCEVMLLDVCSRMQYDMGGLPIIITGLEGAFSKAEDAKILPVEGQESKSDPSEVGRCVSKEQWW